MGEYFEMSYRAQVVRARESSLREGASNADCARALAPSVQYFPFPRGYEPLCFGCQAEGQGGIDLGPARNVDLDALAARSRE
eukprot:5514463-Alexandrium_andersonii.AAC.1